MCASAYVACPLFVAPLLSLLECPLFWIPLIFRFLHLLFFVYVSSFISPPSLSLFCHYTRLRSSTASKTLRRDFSSFTPERTKPVTFIGSATNFSPLPASLSTQSRFRVHFFVVSPFAVLCGLCHFLLPECVARSLSLFLFLFLF